MVREYADRFVNHGVVAGLARRDPPGLLQGGERSASVAVVQLPPSKVDPMMTNPFTRCVRRKPELAGAFDSFGAIEHLDGKPD